MEIPANCKNLEKLYINNCQMGHFDKTGLSDKSIKSILNSKSKLKSITIRGPNSITYKNEPVKSKGGDLVEIYVFKD